MCLLVTFVILIIYDKYLAVNDYYFFNNLFSFFVILHSFACLNLYNFSKKMAEKEGYSPAVLICRAIPLICSWLL